jgi:hypothetical protein
MLAITPFCSFSVYARLVALMPRFLALLEISAWYFDGFPSPPSTLFSSALFKRLEKQRALTREKADHGGDGGCQESLALASLLNALHMDFGAGSAMLGSDLSDIELSHRMQFSSFFILLLSSSSSSSFSFFFFFFLFLLLLLLLLLLLVISFFFYLLFVNVLDILTQLCISDHADFFESLIRYTPMNVLGPLRRSMFSVSVYLFFLFFFIAVLCSIFCSLILWLTV